MTSPVLQEFHRTLGARFEPTPSNDAGRVADYGDPLAEHRALRRNAGILDLSSRGRIVLLGADRRKLLNGQVTNNIKDLQSGQGCYAALVNAKARMLADMNVFALPDELLLDVEPGLATAVLGRLETYIIADDVQVVDATALYGHLGIEGPRSARVLATLGLFPNLPETPLAHVSAHDPALGELYLAHHARVGGQGFDLFAPVGSLETLASRLMAAARAEGGGPVGWTAFEAARVEAGIPRYGIDMNDTHLPPECGIADRAISYTKGCYSGQEVIARIRTYGQVAKALRGLRLSGGGTGTDPDPATGLPAAGTRLFHGGREVGLITSAILSPSLGYRVALGYVRRECNGPGTELDVGSPGDPRKATVVPLPFVGPDLA